jgi:hypothetical protein
MSRFGHLVSRPFERELVGFGGPREAAELADELQGRCPDLFVRGAWFEFMQGLNCCDTCEASSQPDDRVPDART